MRMERVGKHTAFAMLLIALATLFYWTNRTQPEGQPDPANLHAAKTAS